MQKKEKDSSQQSIGRAIKLLNHLGETMTPLNVTEISKLLGISRSTAYAMLKEMIDANFLSKDEKTGKYYLGYQIFILGTKTRVLFLPLLRCDSYLTSFCQQPLPVKATRISLWIMERNYQMVSVLHKEPNSVTPNVPVDQYEMLMRKRVLPSYCTAQGKVMLAELPVKQQRTALLQQELKPYTPATQTDPEMILKELEKVKEQGYCVDVEGYANFEVTVAAPLRDHTGDVIGAVTLSAPKLLYQGHPQDYVQLIIALRNELSALLGHRPVYH